MDLQPRASCLSPSLFLDPSISVFGLEQVPFSPIVQLNQSHCPSLLGASLVPAVPQELASRPLLAPWPASLLRRPGLPLPGTALPSRCAQTPKLWLLRGSALPPHGLLLTPLQQLRLLPLPWRARFAPPVKSKPLPLPPSSLSFALVFNSARFCLIVLASARAASACCLAAAVAAWASFRAAWFTVVPAALASSTILFASFLASASSR